MTAFLFDTAITGWNDLLNYQYNYDKMDNIAAKQTAHLEVEEISWIYKIKSDYLLFKRRPFFFH